MKTPITRAAVAPFRLRFPTGLRSAGLAVGLLGLGLSSAQAEQLLSVLYKRSSDASLTRTNPVAQSALSALEGELQQQNFELNQPSQAVYDRLGDAPGAIITFGRDAGYTVLLETQLQTRPYSGTDMQIAVATLSARVTYGPRIVATLSKLGQVPYKPGNEPLAQQSAAQKAAKDLVKELAGRIQRYQQRLDSGEITATDPTLNPIGGGTPAATTAAQPSVSATAPVARRWALLIGIADFAQVRKLNPGFKVGDLPAVRNDMQRLRATLLDLGYRPDDIVMLIDADATTAKVQAALERLQSQTQPDDQVFVFLGSHGAPRDGATSNFGLPVLYDTTLRASAPLDFDRFKAALRRLPAQRIVWANDTCHSGGALFNEPVVSVSSRNFVVEAGSGFDPALAAASSGKHLAVLASSRDSQLSYNTADNQHGLFTATLTQALQTTAGRLPVGELYHQHLEAQVPQAARQLPCKAPQQCPLVQQPGLAYAADGQRLSLR